jgi:hypothetical protein
MPHESSIDRLKAALRYAVDALSFECWPEPWSCLTVFGTRHSLPPSMMTTGMHITWVLNNHAIEPLGVVVHCVTL